MRNCEVDDRKLVKLMMMMDSGGDGSHLGHSFDPGGQ
jgi:hypothetical protein